MIVRTIHWARTYCFLIHWNCLTLLIYEHTKFLYLCALTFYVYYSILTRKWKGKHLINLNVNNRFYIEASFKDCFIYWASSSYIAYGALFEYFYFYTMYLMFLTAGNYVCRGMGYSYIIFERMGLNEFTIFLYFYSWISIIFPIINY